MDRSSNIRLFHIFVKIFILLLVILLIMPFIVDQAMHFFNESIIPKNNSVIVFKDQVEEYRLVSRFSKALKEITNYMFCTKHFE